MSATNVTRDALQSAVSAADAPSSARAWLDRQRESLGSEHVAWSARETGWSWARLITFFAAVGPWFLPALYPGWVFLISGAFFAAFVYAVRRHHHMRAGLDFTRRRILILDESLKRCGGRVVLIRSFQRPAGADDSEATLPAVLETGLTWQLTDQERDDLDVHAGPVGLFGLLNRTSTTLGCRRLRDWLDQPCIDARRIEARQAAVRWLLDNPLARTRIMAAAAGMRDHEKPLDQLIRAVRRAAPLPRSIPVAPLRVWGILSGVFVLFASYRIGMDENVWVAGLLALAIVNMLIFGAMRRPLADALKPWEDIASATHGYLALARQAAADLPADGELGQLRQRFETVAAPDNLPALCKVLPWNDTGGIFRVLLNVILFYDLHVAAAILKRVLVHRRSLLAGLSALADLEAFASLAVFAAEQPVVCFPTPAPGDAILAIKGARHPLIDPSHVVPNDLHLETNTRTWVITGSNMAGKSTFLRTAAIHTLLAQIGSAVPAERMTFAPVRLITDLRATDNLARDESYFLAEVRQLKRMILPPEDTAPVFGLIDEPFRGTNSEEQVAASLAVLGHLLAAPHFFLVATHERRLTELADDAVARNYHFREDLDNPALVFDYRLRPGPARTRNALRVLKREGYPADLLADAESRIRRSS